MTKRWKVGVGYCYWQKDKRRAPRVCPRCGHTLRLNDAEFASHTRTCRGKCGKGLLL